MGGEGQRLKVRRVSCRTLGSAWRNTWPGLWVALRAFPRRDSHYGAPHSCAKLPIHQSDQQRWCFVDDTSFDRDFYDPAFLYIRQFQCGHKCLLEIRLDCCHCRITWCIKGSQSHVARHGRRFKVYPPVSGAYTELNLGAGWALSLDRVRTASTQESRTASWENRFRATSRETCPICCVCCGCDKRIFSQWSQSD